MKKILVLCFILLCLTGCSADMTNIKPITDMDNVHYYYEPNSKIIYVVCAYRMAPFYSENGKLCRYVDGSIIEIKMQ